MCRKISKCLTLSLINIKTKKYVFYKKVTDLMFELFMVVQLQKQIEIKIFLMFEM